MNTVIVFSPLDQRERAMGRGEHGPSRDCGGDSHRGGAQKRVPVLIDDFGAQLRIHRVSPPPLNCADCAWARPAIAAGPGHCSLSVVEMDESISSAIYG